MIGTMIQSTRIACLAVLVACGNGNEASPEDGRVIDAAVGAGSVSSDVSGMQQEIPRLDDEKLNQWFAALRALGALGQEHPELAEIAAVDANLSDAENAALWERSPELRGAIEGAGLSVLEYMTINSAMIGAMMGGAMLNEEELQELSQVERDNIAFVKANTERVEAMMRELQGMEGR